MNRPVFVENITDATHFDFAVLFTVHAEHFVDFRLFELACFRSGVVWSGIDRAEVQCGQLHAVIGHGNVVQTSVPHFLKFAKRPKVPDDFQCTVHQYRRCLASLYPSYYPQQSQFHSLCLSGLLMTRFFLYCTAVTVSAKYLSSSFVFSGVWLRLGLGGQ